MARETLDLVMQPGSYGAVLSGVYRSLSEHPISVLLEIEEVMITENATDFLHAKSCRELSVVPLSV